jgi:hypothetical protein
MKRLGGFELLGLGNIVALSKRRKQESMTLKTSTIESLIASAEYTNLYKTEDYHEDFGECLFVSFSRDEHGEIIGESPEVVFASGYIQDGFDPEKWTHFMKGSFNFLFTDADPTNFPEL